MMETKKKSTDSLSEWIEKWESDRKAENERYTRIIGYKEKTKAAKRKDGERHD